MFNHVRFIVGFVLLSVVDTCHVRLQELCTVQCSSFSLNVERRNGPQIKDPLRAERVHRGSRSLLGVSLVDPLAVTLPHSMWRALLAGRTSRMFSSE